MALVGWTGIVGSFSNRFAGAYSAKVGTGFAAKIRANHQKVAADHITVIRLNQRP
jgi:hypothetical protein